jgi:hypothetical protein
MSTMPLPALSVNPPADALGGVQRILALKSVLGQQQLQQQDIQRGNIQLQDQQATSAAMREWDGKDYNDLPGLILKNGGSSTAVFSARNQVLDYQTKLTNLTKDQLANEKTKNDYFAEAIDNVKSLPPEQQPDAFEAAKADSVQRGHLDPQVAQKLTYQGPDQLDMLEKNLIGHSAAVDQVVKAAEAKKNVAQANEADVNTALQQVKLKLSKNSGPGDFDAQIDKLAPTTGSFAPLNRQLKTMVNGALSRGDYESANRLLNEGFNQVGQITKETNPDVVAARAQAAAQTASIVEPLRQNILSQFQNQKDARDKIEKDVLTPYQQKVASVSELQNALAQAQQGNVTAARGALLKLMGVTNPDGTKRYNEAEAARMLSQGSIPQRVAGSIQNALTGNNWTPQMVQDMKAFAEGQGQVATQTLDSGIDNINKLYGTSVGRGLKSSGAPAGTGQIQVKDPKGGIHTFPDQASANRFKQLAGIQ